MKHVLTAFLFSFPLFSLAQQTATDVLNAEKGFAAYSVQHGTKAAFLQYADSNSLVFEKGKPANAMNVWRQREASPGVLNWHPVYGWIAQSGELGFTTGPWTFQPKSINDSIVARGQYNTVWHKTENGEWKFLLDIGVGNTPDFTTKTFGFPDEKIGFAPGTLSDLNRAEEMLVQNTNDPANRVLAYKNTVSINAFLLTRNGHLPTAALQELNELMTTMPQTIVYKQDGAGMAKSGDLGYVYGTTTINGKDDNYLRIWRREGNEWKLVLEVLQY